MSILKLLRNERHVCRFRAGQHVFEEGESAESMYFVQSGKVDLYVKGRFVETVGAGGVFGEMALVDRKPRSASAVAQTDCTLVEINQRRFLFFVRETPPFALEIMKTLATRLRRSII